MADYMKSTPQGDPYLDFSALTRDQAAALSEVTVEDFLDHRGEEARSVRRVKFKLHDKQAALVPDLRQRAPADCCSLWPPEGGWLRSTASRLARDETLRMRSFSCSTIVELFHLPSRVLIAMMTSSIVVVISNQWSAIHGMRVSSPLPAGVLKNSQGLAHVTVSWVKCGRNRRTRNP